eukprot:g32608.t1
MQWIVPYMEGVGKLPNFLLLVVASSQFEIATSQSGKTCFGVLVAEMPSCTRTWAWRKGLSQSSRSEVTTGALKQPAQPLKTSGHSSTFGGWQVMLTPPYDTSTIFTFLNGKQFSLRKLEFTSPSENSIDGQSFDMEMQLVHAVMLISSVFLKVGLVDGNEYLSTFWPQFPPKVTPDGTAAQIANPYYAALPGGRSCFIFNGSGTALNASSAHSGFLRFAPPPAGVVQPWSTDLGMNNRITQPQGSRPAASPIWLLALICLLCSGAAKRNVRSKEVYSAESDEDRQPLRRFPQPVANAPMQQRQQMHPQVQLWQQPPSMGLLALTVCFCQISKSFQVNFRATPPRRYATVADGGETANDTAHAIWGPWTSALHAVRGNEVQDSPRPQGCDAQFEIYDGLVSVPWRRVVAHAHHRLIAKNMHVFLIGKHAEQFAHESRG